MKKIGILGSGVVAKALGQGFIKYGHQVKLGTGHPEKLTDWQNEAGDGASVGSFAEAAAYGDILVLAAKGTAAEKVLALAGKENLEGKTIIDATNPIEEGAIENGVLRFFTNINDSLMERLQTAFPGAHFVKAFNSIGSAFMVNPQFEDGQPTMFICGNDENAKAEVTSILDQFGFEVSDMGAMQAARAIEPLCMLWCIPGFRSNQWSHAFKLLKK